MQGIAIIYTVASLSFLGVFTYMKVKIVIKKIANSIQKLRDHRTIKENHLRLFIFNTDKIIFKCLRRYNT